MYIFLDDIRSAPPGATVVRSFEEFRDLIKNTDVSKIREISFDHDLGDESDTEKTGYDAAKWLIEYLIDNNLEMSSLRQLRVHSANPVGSENIRNYFLSAQDANIIPDNVKIG